MIASASFLAACDRHSNVANEEEQVGAAFEETVALVRNHDPRICASSMITATVEEALLGDRAYTSGYWTPPWPEGDQLRFQESEVTTRIDSPTATVIDRDTNSISCSARFTAVSKDDGFQAQVDYVIRPLVDFSDITVSVENMNEARQPLFEIASVGYDRYIAGLRQARRQAEASALPSPPPPASAASPQPQASAIARPPTVEVTRKEDRQEYTGPPLVIPGPPPPPAPLGTPRPSVITNPEWVQRPSGADLARFYPASAGEQGLSGAATIQCVVEVSGFLSNCSVINEAPAGVGFGEATVQAATTYRMRPQTRDGAAIGGARVNITLRWQTAEPD